MAILLPSLSVAVRRMYDVGKSGWYIPVPLYSLILILYDGQNGNNVYGNDPKKINYKLV